MTVALTGTPVLKTDRLILRAPAPGDYAHWEAFFLTDRAEYIGGGKDKGEGLAWRAFASFFGHWALHGMGLFIITRRGEDHPLGAIGPWYPKGWPEKELGWTRWHEDTGGQGIMTEAARRVRAHVYDDLHWPTAVSYIDPRNAASIALAERLGCEIDPDATPPHEDEDPRSLVYRHPAPEGAR